MKKMDKEFWGLQYAKIVVIYKVRISHYEFTFNYN